MHVALMYILVLTRPRPLLYGHVAQAATQSGFSIDGPHAGFLSVVAPIVSVPIDFIHVGQF